MGCGAWPVQDQSAAGVERGGGLAVHPRARPAVQSPPRSPLSQHRLLPVHACHPAGREPPRRALVVGATGVARMRPASPNTFRGPTALRHAAPAMDYLPVFLRLDGQPVVVVGGGSVALRKTDWLRKAGARVTVVAPRLHPQLALQVAHGELTHVAAEFSAAQLARAVAVVAATSRPAVNAAVSAAARARGVPVNVVDDAQLSSFIFPAIIDRSPIVVAVSS